jgi:hypothetical protein
MKENLEQAYEKVVSDYKTRIAELEAEAEVNQAVIDTHWDADMRAIKLWREGHPEREHILPDQTKLVLWLLEQLDNIPTLEEAIAIINNYRGMCTFPPLVPWCNECLNYDCNIRGLRTKLQKITDK